MESWILSNKEKNPDLAIRNCFNLVRFRIASATTVWPGLHGGTVWHHACDLQARRKTLTRAYRAIASRRHQYRQRAQQNDIQQRRVDSIQRVPISTLLTSRHTEPFISRSCATSCRAIAAPTLPKMSTAIARALASCSISASCHHWRGIHFGLSSLLPKALKLYAMSFSLVQNGANFDTQHLVLALLNNMGHVRHELLQYNQARQ
jgi:hypothetical protein